MEEESDPEDIAYGESATPRKKRLKEPVYAVTSVSIRHIGLKGVLFFLLLGTFSTCYRI